MPKVKQKLVEGSMVHLLDIEGGVNGNYSLVKYLRRIGRKCLIELPNGEVKRVYRFQIKKSTKKQQ